MAEKVDAIVVGAGVIGLAVARALAQSGREVLILESESQFGSATSSRNSEVIHAGIYYPTGSLKAVMCVEGKELLYAYCRERAVPHRQLGKLIFAHSPDQAGELDKIVAAATAAGVHDLRRLARADAKAIEPALDCAEALFSPSTGIIDSHAYMMSLLADAEDRGATLVCNSPVARISHDGGYWQIHLEVNGPAEVAAPLLINAAGLGAKELAGRIETLDPQWVPPLYLARGVYFSYSGKTPFSHLIYPTPVPGGLGTHLTLDMGGQVRFGPDVEWIDSVDYRVDPNRRGAFAEAARRIWPDLDPDRLEPAYAGIRPKLSAPGAPPADFLLSGPRQHGRPGLLNFFGIESPGLTSSLALARLAMKEVEAA